MVLPGCGGDVSFKCLSRSSAQSISNCNTRSNRSPLRALDLTRRHFTHSVVCHTVFRINSTDGTFTSQAAIDAHKFRKRKYSTLARVVFER